MTTVSLRVVPLNAEVHLGMISGPFVILDFPRSTTGAREPTTIYVEVWTGALYLDKPQEVKRYETAWRNTNLQALDESASRDLIQAVAEEMAS